MPRFSTRLACPRICAVAGLAAVAAFSGSLSGCQTVMGGQTLPSAYYLRDDVQYHPAGPEFKLSNTVRALEDYRNQKAGLDADL